MKKEINKKWNIIKVSFIVVLLIAISVSSQRTDIEETSTTHSEMGEYSINFYNNTGNDSVFYFDSDIFGTHVLTLDGPAGSITGNDATFDSLTFGRFFQSSYGGTIDAGGDPWYFSGTSLQIAENLTVDHDITATNFIGDGSQLTGLSAGDPGGNDGQIQYNNSGDFSGAYYYKDGNMTSSLDGTWGYYEDDTLIVIGNLSYVSIYKD